MSVKEESSESDLGIRIATRVRQLRSERGYTLDTLAAKSGVSRSAISMIERSATSPTAVVLEKLATGLDTPLASLFDAPPAHDAPSPIARRSEQPSWRDPESGYLRRNVSPPNRLSPIQIVEVEFPAGATVTYESADREATVYQQVWVLSGQIEVTVGEETHLLREGDCLAMRLGQPIGYHNASRRPTRYAVVLISEPVSSRKVA